MVAVLAGTVVAAPPRVAAAGVMSYFTDEFDGGSLSSNWDSSVATSGARWCEAAGTWLDPASQSCGGHTAAAPYGSVAVSGGAASLAAGTIRAAPYVWRGGPGGSSPFPSTGDWRLEVRIRYDQITNGGSGLQAANVANSTPTGTNAREASILGLWGDTVNGLKASIPGGSSYTVPSNTSYHVYQWEYVAGAYSLFVDGVLRLGPTSSANVPNFVLLGNQVFTSWTQQNWSDFTIDYLRTFTLTGPQDPPPGNPGPSNYFEDEFEAGPVSATRWNTSILTSGKRFCEPANIWKVTASEPCNGKTSSSNFGGVTVSNGAASIAAGTEYAFPYLWRGEPSQPSPFPSTGDWRFVARIRFDQLTALGTGLQIAQVADSTPTGSNARGGGVFGLWGDSGGGVRIGLAGAGNWTVPSNTSYHVYTLQYIGGQYSVYVDGVLRLGPAASSTVPNFVYFGNQVFAYWGAGNWTDFTVDYVRTVSLSGQVGLSQRAALLGHRLRAGYVSDPVNTSTGNLTDTKIDLESAGGVAGFDWVRTYNSQDHIADRPLGRRWTGAYDQSVVVDGNGMLFTDGDGRRVRFTPNGSGGWVSPEETFGVLKQRPDSSFAIEYYSGEVREFSLSGRLEQIVTVHGVTLTVTHGGAGPSSVSSSTGASLAFTYSGNRLTTATASDGRAVSYGYNTAGHLTSITAADSKVTNLTVDATGLITAVTDPSGIVRLTNVYDSERRVTQQTSASGSVTTFAYNTLTRTTTVTDQATGQTLAHTYDDAGRVIGITDPASGSLTKTYDATGNLATIVDRLGAQRTETVDAHGNLTSVSDPVDGETTYAYDAQDRLTTVTDDDDNTTTLAYEGSERTPSSITDALDHTTLLDVDNGLVESSTDADGVSTTYTYNTARQVTTITDGLGNTTTYAYDPAGRLSTVTTPEGRVTSTVYDALGRLLSETAPDGGIATYTYDNAGRLLTTTDPTGAVTTRAYDSAGRLASVTTPLGAVTTYGYDTLDQLTTITEPGGATIVNTYEPLGRLASITDQLGRTTTHAYDADGNRTSKTDPAGGTTSTSYDTAGRPAQTTDQLGRTTTNTYDDLGRLATVTAPGGLVTEYTYDALDRTLTTTDARGGVTTTDYTSGGRIATITDPAGRTTTYAYDDAGRMTSVTEPGNLTTTYTYDDDGLRTTETSPGGNTTTTIYDSASRPVTVTEPTGVQTTNTWSPRGELLTQATTGAGTITYTYDAEGRPTAVTEALGHETTFGYDARGNRTTVTDALDNEWTATFNAADELESETDPLGRTTAHTYDPAGRPATITDASGRTTTNAYDLAGQLTSRAYANGLTTTFAYNPAGHLASATDPTGTHTYAYEPGGQLTLATSPAGRALAFLYDNAGQRVGARRADGTGFAYTHDNAGRVATITRTETFADTFTGDDGAAIDAAKWNVTTSSATPTITDNEAVLSLDDTADAEVALAPQVPATSDVEIALRYRHTSTAASARLELAGRIDGTPDQVSYSVTIESGSATATVNATSSGTTTPIGTFTVPVTTDAQRLRFRINGDQLRVRTWADGTPEPETWTAQLTDTTISSVGSMQITAQRISGASTVIVDDVVYNDLASPLTPTVEYNYNDDSQITNEVLPGSSQRTWSYTNGRLTAYAQDISGAQRSTALTYDTTGRVDSETTDSATISYAYDAASQLTEVAPPSGPTTTYTYDPLGRRVTEYNGTQTSTYTYDTAGQLTDITRSAGPTTVISYDAAGRRLDETTGPDQLEYAYDPAGRLATLTRTTGGSTTTQTRAYNPNKQLSQITNVTTTATDAWSLDWDPAAEIPTLIAIGNKNLTTHAARVSTLTTGAADTAVALDIRGSVIAAPGQDLSRATDYDAFGTPTGADTFEPTLGYRGALHLDALIHFTARDYTPATGSFTTTDPQPGVTGTPTINNPYHYADNDPLNKTDPTGEFSVPDRLLTRSSNSRCPGVAPGAQIIIGNCATADTDRVGDRVKKGAVLGAAALVACIKAGLCKSPGSDESCDELHGWACTVEVLVDTSAVYKFRVLVPVLESRGERGVISTQVETELRDNKLAYPAHPFTRVPDESNFVAMARMRQQYAERTGRGTDGDLVIGTTAISTRRKLYSSDDFLVGAVGRAGGKAEFVP